MKKTRKKLILSTFIFEMFGGIHYYNNNNRRVTNGRNGTKKGINKSKRNEQSKATV